MLVDVNELLLAEQKKLKYLAFSIKPKNKHNLILSVLIMIGGETAGTKNM